MANTDRMKWPYPDEHVDPWYDAFVGLMRAMDASGYAAREDRNLHLMGGGQVSFTLSTSTVTWASKIRVLSPTVGFFTEIAAGSVVLNNGEVMYLDIVRNPTQTQTVTVQTASTLPSSDTAYFLAVRVGSFVYFRGGSVLGDGQSSEIFEGGHLISAGQRIRQVLTMATASKTTQDAPLVVGGGLLDPSALGLNYLTTEVRFQAIASISNVATPGTVDLYNLTDGAVEASLSVTSTALTKLDSGLLTLPSAEKLYEVRIYTSVAGTDTVNIDWAGFQIDLVR